MRARSGAQGACEVDAASCGEMMIARMWRAIPGFVGADGVGLMSRA
jgi:hypothetical protein